MPGFHDDAIILSGLHGTGLKSRFLGQYYSYWWRIASGGASAQNRYSTAIVDFYAATGEVYLKDKGETLLGSTGHALEMKFNPPSGSNSENLTVVAVESDQSCYDHLSRVVRRRWPAADVRPTLDFTNKGKDTVWVVRCSPAQAIDALQDALKMNSIFLFDPLLCDDWSTLESLARSRLTIPFKTGTEFIIFVFTSDWFSGRDFGEGDFLNPLPRTTNFREWARGEAESVAVANRLFGDSEWQAEILRDKPREDLMARFVTAYERRLHAWFRYVLPMPFAPKSDQRYHLFFCSNNFVGFSGTRGNYCDVSGNPEYEPDNKAATQRFRDLHPNLFSGLKATQKPLHWKMLWRFIKSAGHGVCDEFCFVQDGGTMDEASEAMEWLQTAGYMSVYQGPTGFTEVPQRLTVNWDRVRAALGVGPARPFVPMSKIAQVSLTDV